MYSPVFSESWVVWADHIDNSWNTDFYVGIEQFQERHGEDLYNIISSWNIVQETPTWIPMYPNTDNYDLYSY